MGLFQRLFGLGSKSSGSSGKKEEESAELPFEIKITTSYNHRDQRVIEEPFGSITGSAASGWVINPGASFPITILHPEKSVAEKLRAVLDDESRDYRKEDKLLALFATYNIRVKEIEDYKAKYKQSYLNSIEQQKAASPEWQQSGDLDKEDLLIEFREKALKNIYEVANADLEVLFECEPGDITMDDQLIEEFGFENMQLYLRYADRPDKIRVIGNDDHYRPIFEKLVELKLAVRGMQIPKEEILAFFTLKELNEMVKKSGKEFKKKTPAIEFVAALPEADSLISKKIALRELFKLTALPEKYAGINLGVISSTWKYHMQEARLLKETYRASYSNWRNLKDKEYVVGYEVVPDEFIKCPCALELAKKKYKKNSPPTIPYHIGCTCYLDKEEKYD